MAYAEYLEAADMMAEHLMTRGVVPEESSGPWDRWPDLARTAQALRSAACALRGEGTFQEAYQQIASLADRPPAHKALAVQVLSTASGLAARVNRMVQGRRWQEAAADLARSTGRCELVALAAIALAQYEAAQGDYRSAGRSLDNAMAPELNCATPMGYRLRASRAAVALGARDLDLASRLIESLKPHAHLDSQSALPVANIELRLLALVGDYHQGLALLERLDKHQRATNPRQILHSRLTFLIQAGRLDQAREILDRSHPPLLTSQHRTNYLALIALRQGQTQDARRLAYQAMEAGDAPDRLMLDQSLRLMLAAALVDRDALDARRLLERIDLSAGRDDTQMEWCRLKLLEGDLPGAAKHFRGIYDRGGPKGVQSQLRYAYELSAQQLAGLYAAVLTDDRAGGAPDTSAVPISSMLSAAPSIVRGTLPRRCRLRNLLETYGRLTRAQAAHLLGCAPVTAARDLAALAREGLARRVETSAHARTSYYQHVSPTGPD